MKKERKLSQQPKVGSSRLLEVLTKEDSQAEEDEKKYLNSTAYQYYQGYRDAIEFALAKAREHLVSASNTGGKPPP